MWIGLANGTFEDNCDELNDGENQAKTCLEDGPNYGLAILVLIQVQMILYVVFYCCYRKKDDIEVDETIKEEGENQDKKEIEDDAVMGIPANDEPIQFHNQPIDVNYGHIKVKKVEEEEDKVEEEKSHEYHKKYS